MKIEIGESLIYSYLRHVEGCRVVQTNWTPSSKWVIKDFNKERAKNLYERVLKDEGLSQIFKGNNFDQLVKQAEIDVLGINTTEQTIYGIDVAVHLSGLNYGGKHESAERICKKMVRTIFILQIYFDDYENFYSLFFTPKSHKSFETEIVEKMERVKKIINNNTQIKIDFIANERFFEEIYNRTADAIKEDNDSNELFARFYKLDELKSKLKSRIRTEGMGGIIDTSAYTRLLSSNDKRTENGMKIGQYAQSTFVELWEENLISPQEIEKLQKVDYSKRTFNVNYAVLIPKHESGKDKNGRQRYYQNKIFCGNYKLTSQWYEPQWDCFLRWEKAIKKSRQKN